MTEIGIILLAGGESRRMGTDKALLRLEETTFIQKIHQTAGLLSDHITVVAPKGRYEDFGWNIIQDEFPGGGPAAGIHSGLRYSISEINLVLPCDLPLLTAEFLKILIQTYQGQDALIFRTGEKIHPVLGIYHKRTFTVFDEALRSGKRKMTDILSGMQTAYFEVPKQFRSQLENINTTQDYQNLNHGTHA